MNLNSFPFFQVYLIFFSFFFFSLQRMKVKQKRNLNKNVRCVHIFVSLPDTSFSFVSLTGKLFISRKYLLFPFLALQLFACLTKLTGEFLFEEVSDMYSSG